MSQEKSSISFFFIDRPVFSSVIAILIMLAGSLSILFLPVAQFPHLTPPTISLVVDYAGASAQTMQDTVAQVIEQRMVGLDNLLYISTNSSAEGRTRMAVTFAASMNSDIAQMQVQNRLQMAMPMLPDTVKEQGVRVRKVSDSFLQFYSFFAKDGSIAPADIGDFISSVVVDPLSRVDGVGDVVLFASPYAMKIWLNPNKLRSFSLTPMDVANAVQAQNSQISVGQIGGLPAVPNQEQNVTLLSRAKLTNIQQFEEVVVRVLPDGSAVKVKDVARVEMGLQSYNVSSRFKRVPATSLGIQLAEGANAMETSERVAAFIKRMEPLFPDGLIYEIPYDTVPFIKESIKSVRQTLIEAILLVGVIMFIFLQSWRATLIPTMAVPIVLLGTFATMSAFHMSINTLSMFGLVLAIGLLVDDAIVVVENTERIIHVENLDPQKAIRKSMGQITSALIGVAAVLSAVFIPMAFFAGMPGTIYREFSITIVSAMVLSVFVAITITPPMCSLLLRQQTAAKQQGVFGRINYFIERATEKYSHAVATWIKHKGVVMIVYAGIVLAAGYTMYAMPKSFLPVEDQGVVLFNIFMPPGTTREATSQAAKEIEDYMATNEKDLVEAYAVMLGLGPYGSRGQSVAAGYVRLRHWDERPKKEQSAAAIVARARAHFARNSTARILFFQPPQVRGLGQASGISLQLEDQGNLGYLELIDARAKLLATANASPLLSNVRTSSLDDIPQLYLDIDDLKAGAYSLTAADINDNISTAWGGLYVNDFVDRGRVKRVYVQGEAPYRMNQEDLQYWYVRNSKGEMVPVNAFAKTKWTFGSSQLERFNGVQSTIIEAMPGPGVSSGDAMAELVRLIGELPHGIGYEWTGLSYMESRAGSQTIYLYSLSILVVFLCLAALYESWTIPFAVILVVPIGILGALLLSTLRGLYNDIYFQVGILAVIGLSAKNAILIVEFAKSLADTGLSLTEAAVQAATMRLRPIVMTSLAFLLGVMPLVTSTGAGSNSQHAIGTGIVGGTFLATVLGIFFIPVFFVVVSKVFGYKEPHEKETDSENELTINLEKKTSREKA